MTAGRRLLLFLDGTWNEDAAHDRDTNVVRLRDTISNGVTSGFRVPRSIDEFDKWDREAVEFGACPYRGCIYFTFYERGVGTGPGLDRLSGGALGWGVERNVRRAYRFLSRHYIPGSEIFIFGFSRGAHAARSLVGFLGSAGLLRAENCTIELEKQAWDYYRTSPNDRMPGIRTELGRYVYPALRVACLGVFDSVATLGVPINSFWRLNRQRHEFHDVLLSPLVKLNLHALAIDETRVQFRASVWRQSKFRVSNSVTEQTWFPGTHSDIGGGYFSDQERDSGPRRLDDVPLDWMLKRILYHYPDFPIREPGFVPLPGAAVEPSILHNSRTGHYRVFPPVIRTIGNRRPPLLVRERPVSYERDEAVVGESIHISALERLATRPACESKMYLPRNLIVHLPNLWQRYCIAPGRAWDSDAVSITIWDGHPVLPGIGKENSKDAAALNQVQKALVDAISRLKELGYDVLSENEKWNPAAVVLTLASGKKAPKSFLGRCLSTVLCQRIEPRTPLMKAIKNLPRSVRNFLALRYRRSK
ncbi:MULTISPECIES: DUF2235 domain-containing protein [Bradyrhizobium]